MGQSKVLGNSDRGPAELDEAKKNLGLPPDAVMSEDDDPEALASGEVVEQGDEGPAKPAPRRARKGEGARDVAGQDDPDDPKRS